MRQLSILCSILALLLVSGEVLAKRQVQMPPKDTRLVSGKGDIGISFVFAGLSTLLSTGLGAATRARLPGQSWDSSMCLETNCMWVSSSGWD